MQHPSIEQATQLAKQYATLGLSVSIYKFNNFNSLLPEQRKALDKQHAQLESYSQDYVQIATNLIFEDAATDITNIVAITKAISTDIFKLKKLEILFNIIGATVTLGGAIISKNTADIKAQIHQLAEAWKKAKALDNEQDVLLANNRINNTNTNT